MYRTNSELTAWVKGMGVALLAGAAASGFIACSTASGRGSMASPSVDASGKNADQPQLGGGEADVVYAPEAGDAAEAGGDSAVAVDPGPPDGGGRADGYFVQPLTPDFDGSCPVDGRAGGSPVTVNGHVYSMDGHPVGDETVMIQGKSTVTATDGSFTMAGVVPPYDLTIAEFSGTNTYVGLTRVDPTVLDPVTGFQGYGETLQVNVPFGDAELPAMWFVLDATQGSSGGNLDIETPSNTGEGRLDAEWTAGASASATLLAFSGFAGGPGVTGLTSQTVSLTSGTLATYNIHLAPPTTTSTLSGSVILPSGYTEGHMELGLSRGMTGATSNRSLASVNTDYSAAPTFSYGTFTSNLSWALTYSADNPSGGQVASTTVAALHGDETSVAVDVPACDLQQVSPADHSTAASSCVGLSWTAATTPTVYVVTITIGGEYGGVPYQIITDQTSVQIPYPLPSTTCYWRVRAISTAKTVDGLAASLTTLAPLSGGRLVVSHTECETNPAGVQFTVP